MCGSQASSLHYPPLPSSALVEFWEQHRCPTPVVLTEPAGPLETALEDYTCDMFGSEVRLSEFKGNSSVGGGGLFDVHTPITMPLREARAGTQSNRYRSKDHGEMLLALFSFLSCIYSSGPLPRDDTDHSGLDPPTLIKN